MFGFLSLNKPCGITSRDAVNRIQRIVRPHKVGHCGTLDPLATGVLVICVGPSTRLASYVQEAPKTYLGQFRFGFRSDTEDTEGEVLPTGSEIQPTIEQLQSALPAFTGNIDQLPPKFSALKVNGRRAYDLARKGKPVELKSRPVTVYQLRIVKFNYPDFTLEIQCGAGTYIRSLGRDIGQHFGCGAIMTKLERTAIGPFSIEESVLPDDVTAETIASQLVSPQIALKALPSISVSDEQTIGFSDGVTIDVPGQDAENLVAIDNQSRLIGLLRHRGDGVYSPKLNFAHYWLGKN